MWRSLVAEPAYSAGFSPRGDDSDGASPSEQPSSHDVASAGALAFGRHIESASFSPAHHQPSTPLLCHIVTPLHWPGRQKCSLEGYCLSTSRLASSLCRGIVDQTHRTCLLGNAIRSSVWLLTMDFEHGLMRRWHEIRQRCGGRWRRRLAVGTAGRRRPVLHSARAVCAASAGGCQQRGRQHRHTRGRGARSSQTETRNHFHARQAIYTKCV